MNDKKSIKQSINKLNTLLQTVTVPEWRADIEEAVFLLKKAHAARTETSEQKWMDLAGTHLTQMKGRLEAAKVTKRRCA